MSIDPDQDDRLDIDLTDELPILIETAVLESEARVTVAVGDDETGEHTARFLELASQEAESVEALKSDLQQRAAKIEALERDIGRLSGRWLEIERHLIEKDGALGNLSAALETAQSELGERRAAEERLGAEIVDRDNQFARLLDETDLLRKQAAESRAELERVQSEREIERVELATLRAELERIPAPNDGQIEIDLREQLDTLTSYITNRRVWWDELESRATGQAARIAELERDVAERAKREAAIESTAAREGARADELRAQLVGEARRAEALDAEVKQLRTDPAATRLSLDRITAELDLARAEILEAQRERDRSLEALAALQQEQRARDERHAEALAAEERRRALAEQAATAAAANREGGAAAAAAMTEAVAQLEAELEHKRAELSLERATAKDREEKRLSLTLEIEAARQQAADARMQLEQARADAARMERALVEKDRALDARDERIRTLQFELDQRLGALQKLSAMDLSLQGLDSKMSERLRRTDSVPDSQNTPALICLTSDTPRQYALAKRTMSIGRSSQCDIQILTHFVSREHARLTVSPRGSVVLEDLGSTNGVFVNSVRIDRQELHHGDLVTVGESQFRFLETMSH
jgi:chromosome segregation ATPase